MLISQMVQSLAAWILKHDPSQSPVFSTKKTQGNFSFLWLQISILFLQAGRYDVSPHILALLIRKDLLFQYTIAICMAEDQNHRSKITECQPTNQESISEIDLGDFWLKVYLKTTDWNCVPMSSSIVHWDKLFGMVG